MAIMKLTAFNGGLKGKIAGTVFQSSPFGQVARTKPSFVPKNDKLTHADAGRVFIPKRAITKIATMWRTMTDAQRQAWINAGVNFPFLNRFGESYTPSGFQLFMSINTKLYGAGYTALTAVPAPGAIVNAGAFTVTHDALASSLEMSDPTIPAGYYAVLKCTGPVSPGKLPKNSLYKTLSVLDHDAVFPYTLGSDYSDNFSTPPAAATIWFKLEYYNQANAQVGQPYIYKLVY